MVLNDAFKENADILAIIVKVSKDIVSKPSFSYFVAEKLRELNKKFKKKTRPTGIPFY